MTTVVSLVWQGPWGRFGVRKQGSFGKMAFSRESSEEADFRIERKKGALGRFCAYFLCLRPESGLFSYSENPPPILHAGQKLEDVQRG